MRSSLSKRDRFSLRLPYSSRKTPDTEELIVWRWKILSLISIIFLLAVLYFFLFSSYFRIISIESTQALFIPNKEVTEVIDEFISKKRYFILRQDNYFSLSKKELKKTLEDAFKFRKVTIVKEAPNGLFVYFKEQISVFIVSIVNEGDEVGLFDHKGERIQTLKKESFNSELPFVTLRSYDSVDEDLASIVLSSWEISNLQNSNFKILGYLEQEDQLIAMTDKDFEIRFSLTADGKSQVNNLKVMQQAFLKGEPLPSEYIELRFGEKVFIK